MLEAPFQISTGPILITKEPVLNPVMSTIAPLSGNVAVTF
jgi:hypothetical protein